MGGVGSRFWAVLFCFLVGASKSCLGDYSSLWGWQMAFALVHQGQMNLVLSQLGIHNKIEYDSLLF